VPGGEPPFEQLLFGLRVRSPVAIPYAPPLHDAGAPDLYLHPGALPPWLETIAREPYFRDDEPRFTVDRCANGAYLFRYPDATTFVLDGADIWMAWREPLIFEDACTYLVGPILAFVMRLRGAACLHASAVEVEGRAIAIAGLAGAGKSTLAAALVTAGATLIAEDVVALRREEGGKLLCVPSYAGIRLWPESVELLFGRRDALPAISPTWDKRMLETTATATPRELAAVYFLDRGEAPSIEPVADNEALLRLVACSYRNELLDASMRRREFELFAAAASLPLRALTRGPERDPRSLVLLVARDAKMLAAPAQLTTNDYRLPCTTSSTTAG
jgi:hypothetical protein